MENAPIVVHCHECSKPLMGPSTDLDLKTKKLMIDEIKKEILKGNKKERDVIARD